MAGSGGPSAPSPALPPPKILLAKPGLVTAGAPAGKFGRSSCGAEEEAATLRSRLPSLNLLSDSWEFHIDRFLPVLSLLVVLFYPPLSVTSNLSMIFT